MQKIELPDYLKNITDDSARDMVTNTGGAPRISIRGRQFRFIVGGEEVHKQTEPIFVVILGVVPEAHMAKTFYIDGYQPGATDPPDCSSFLGEVPDTWVDSPQAERCRDCANNKWGSALSMSGKKAKACKDSKRLMVINAKSVEEDEPMIYIFNITVASLKALSEYGKFLIQNQLPMAAVVTSISFVDSEFPQVELNFGEILNEQFGTEMITRSMNKEWLDGLDTPALPAPKKQVQIESKTVASAETEQVIEQRETAVQDNTKKQSTEDLVGKW